MGRGRRLIWYIGRKSFNTVFKFFFWIYLLFNYTGTGIGIPWYVLIEGYSRIRAI